MASDLLTADDLAELEFAIASVPDAHPMISGCGGVRKMRWARSGMGKRGGIRVIYFHAVRANVILLIAAYAKNVQEDLTSEQKAQIRKAVRAFEESLEA